MTNHICQRAKTTSSGFLINLDYITGLPKRTNYCQAVFGIYNNITGETVYQNKLFHPTECEIENSKTFKCIFNQNHQVFGVAPNE